MYKLLKTLVAPAELTYKSFMSSWLKSIITRNSLSSCVVFVLIRVCDRKESQSQRTLRVFVICGISLRIRGLREGAHPRPSSLRCTRRHTPACPTLRSQANVRQGLRARIYPRVSGTEYPHLLRDSSGTALVHFADSSGPSKDAPSGKSCYTCESNPYAKDCHFKDAV